MSNDNVIYVVTQGSYSDYHICGVFDDQRLAERMADKLCGDVETYHLNPFAAEIRSDLYGYKVLMDRQGNVIEARRWTFNTMDAQGYHTIWHDDRLFNHCWAKDEQHAIKITNEVRIQLIASNQWPEEE
jgi:hypothetical protein